MDNEIKNLKEFLHEKFESHEELEALRFKRIDELLSQYGKVDDTFADIAVYSILARILFRKEQEKQQELTELERGKCSTDYGEPRFMSPKHYEEEEICKMCPSCGEENKNGVELGMARLNECYDCGYKYYHAEALARHKYAKRAEAERRARDN